MITRFLCFTCVAYMFAIPRSYGELPPPISERSSMLTATQIHPELNARSIIENAYMFSGGDRFRYPTTLFLSGYNIIRSRDGSETLWQDYAMWREFAQEKPDAHKASGKVRIEAWHNQELALFLAFDGNRTYNQDGIMEGVDADKMWANNFGFSAIRHALDQGWQQTRNADDMIDGVPAYMVTLTDPSGGSTLFGFRQKDFAILYVGFNTAKGWHERRYSNFFRKPGDSWLQAGRVRLFYNGIKANEAIWTDYSVNEPLGQELFTPEATPIKPNW